jgi:UPF0755 protein
LIFSLLVALLIGAGGGLTAWAWHLAHMLYSSYQGSQVVVDIRPGQGSQQILDTLEERGVIRSAALARVYLQFVLESPPLLAGEYQFDSPLNMPQTLTKLISGAVVMHPVTILEGLTIEETAQHLADSGFGSFDTFKQLGSSPALIADWDPEATDLEGYLFPDTYSFARDTAEEIIIQSMVKAFRTRSGNPTENLAQKNTRSLRQIVTLASIVEKEAQADDERPIIAGVYI